MMAFGGCLCRRLALGEVGRWDLLVLLMASEEKGKQGECTHNPLKTLRTVSSRSRETLSHNKAKRKEGKKGGQQRRGRETKVGKGEKREPS